MDIDWSSILTNRRDKVFTYLQCKTYIKGWWSHYSLLIFYCHVSMLTTDLLVLWQPASFSPGFFTLWPYFNFIFFTSSSLTRGDRSVLNFLFRDMCQVCWCKKEKKISQSKLSGKPILRNFAKQWLITNSKNHNYC